MHSLQVSPESREETPIPGPPKSYFELMAMPPQALANVDIARMNLLFAANLPGSESLQVEECLKSIDELAAYVKQRTEALHFKFETNPENFRNSEAFFKMTVLVTVLQQEKHLIYDPKFAIRPGEGYDAVAKAEMGTSSKHLFINGLLTGEHSGTCSSMPVLWASIGRRLGYPLKLAHAKNHLFVRWEDDKERFNIEASRGVMASPPDEEYKKWPFPLTDEEIAKGPYLKSLTPEEEMADAANARFWELLHYHRYDEALGIAIQIHKLLPKADIYRVMARAASPLLDGPPSIGPGSRISPAMEAAIASVTPGLPGFNPMPSPNSDLPSQVTGRTLPGYVQTAITGESGSPRIPGVPAIAMQFLPSAVQAVAQKFPPSQEISVSTQPAASPWPQQQYP